MAANDSDISELIDDDDENYIVVLMPPTETQFVESDASDAGVEGDSAHMPRRVLRQSGELLSNSDKPQVTRKPLPTGPKPTKDKKNNLYSRSHGRNVDLNKQEFLGFIGEMIQSEDYSIYGKRQFWSADEDISVPWLKDFVTKIDFLQITCSWILLTLFAR